MKTTSVPQKPARPATPRTTHGSSAARGATLSASGGEGRGEVATQTSDLTPHNCQAGVAVSSEALLTKEEVAVHCQVCLRTVDAWMKRGALKYLKIGSRVRFRLSDVDRHLTEFYGNGERTTNER